MNEFTWADLPGEEMLRLVNLYNERRMFELAAECERYSIYTVAQVLAFGQIMLVVLKV
jgi:hypothetical protein